MGRYYSGDIEGKFGFGVQASNDADFFGVTGHQAPVLEYHYEEEDLETVEQGLKECEKSLGGYKEKITEFFNKNDSYNNKILSDFLNVSEIKTKCLLEWYFRYELGIKIRDCIKNQGCCYFEAELE
jgi:hypothetical protein